MDFKLDFIPLEMDEDNQLASFDAVNQLNYSTFKSIKNMINDEKLSDVTFLVGEDKKMMYGHKLILSVASPVFEKMFYGEFEQKSDAIEVTDITEIGFLNMLKYIYDYEIDYDLSELYVTYKALDKYLVYGYEKKNSEYIEKKLNKSNCCIIYDQLVKMEKNDDYLDFVKSFIQVNCSATFFTESFLKIDEDTLIKLLNLDYLNLDEFNILKACLNWVNYKFRECADNDELLNLKQEKFDKIKNYINFSELTVQELGWFSEFGFLSFQEVGALFMLTLAQNNKIDKEVTRNEAIIKCITKRRSIRPFTVEDNLLHLTVFKKSFLTRYLSVNRKIFISSISTTVRSNVQLKLFVFENEIDLKTGRKREVDKKWCFYFTPCLELEPGTKYKLQFILDSNLNSDHFSEKEFFKYSSKNYTVDIHLECINHGYHRENRFHFIQKIEFFDSSLSSLS